jgi:hypothetical protein
MNGYDITLTILIILIFVVLFLTPMFSVGIQKIQQNWVKYRCNPMVMPFASLFGHDPSTTFATCTQSTLKDLMGMLLLPMEQSMNVLGTMGGGVETAINDARKIISSIRSLVTEIVQSIFGVFLNILVEMQKMMIRLKDTMGKLIAIMTSLLFMVNGTMQAMQSAWNGPPGQLTRALCFKGNTEIQLFDGGFREIKDLEIGNILKDGGVVDGILQLKNTSRASYYKLEQGEKGSPIYVTGSHMILDPISEHFIPVSKHHQAIKTNIQDEIVYSLMTSNQRIPIGKHMFWDWNDDEVAK